MIPKIYDGDEELIATGFECENKNDNQYSISLCKVQDNLESMLALTITFNEDTYLLIIMFYDFKRGALIF